MSRPWPIMLTSAVLFLLAVLCATFFFFTALYYGEYLTAVLVLVLGFSAMTICYGLWTYQIWAWYASVALLVMSTLTDLLFAIFRQPMPAAIRGVLTAILLGLLLPPKLRSQFKDVHGDR